jgi:hypothetical protein
MIPGLMQIGTRKGLLPATSRSFTPLSGPIFLTLEEVVERYRGQVSEGIVAEFSQLFASLKHRPLANLNAYRLSPVSDPLLGRCRH